MGLVTGIAVYVVVWWVLFLAVLPWGVHPPDQPGPGHVASAPARPRIGLKALVTTGLAGVIWLAIELVVRSNLISFRDWAG